AGRHHAERGRDRRLPGAALAGDDDQRTIQEWGLCEQSRGVYRRRDVGSDDADRVSDSYRRCRRMQLRHDPTYFAATRCLPADRRPAVHALYGYVRGADQIADGAAGLLVGDLRRAALDAWERELRDGLVRGSSDHPVIAALVDAGPRHDLPLDLVPQY